MQSSVATNAETDKCRKCNDLPINYYFQPLAIETTGVYGKSTAPFLSCLAKKLVDISGDHRDRRDSGSTSACLWPWSEGTPLAYWPVCKFDLILATLSALTSAPHSCPSLASLQWIAIAFRMPVFSVSFIVFSMFFYAFCKSPVQYCFAPLFSHPD